LLIRGVCCGNNETVVALAEDNDAVRVAQLRVEQILGEALVIDGIEIEQRGAEGGGERVREVCGGHCTRAGQLCNEAGTAAQGLLVDVLCDLCRQACRPKRERAPSPGGRFARVL
jgi:hypothetical protein